jgi:DNA repair exonuclease SbcCD nuclease subunit
MIRFLITIADIHIRANSKHEEHKEVLINFINDIKPFMKEHGHETRILVLGDLVDNFLTISNEMEIFVSWFLKELDSLGTTIVISGNHDLVRNNVERVDSITPFFHMIDFKNTSYMDMVTGYKSACVLDENIIWALYSIHDSYSRPDIEKIKEENPDKIFVGLFHGAVIGSKNDMGFTMNKGVNSTIFNGCSFVCAGDIHRRQLLKNKDGVGIYYPGSLIQKNFGETIYNHGYSIIEIPSFSITHHEVENPHKFYKFKIENIDDILNDKEVLTNVDKE